MAQSPQSDVIKNGPDDDMFEHDLKEMLKDGPALSDMSNTVQGGLVQGGTTVQAGNTHSSTAAHSIPRSMPAKPPTTLEHIPRSHSVPPATSTIPLTSPDRNGFGSATDSGATSPKSAIIQAKLDTLKAWSINTYKCTRQVISERFGKGSRTVDLELEGQIEALKDTQKKYANILRLARAMSSHFYNVVQTQRALGEAFSEMSQKNPELQEEFSYNSETQKTLSKNGETLLGALNFFISSVNTLCNKTMEDTLMTIKSYEASRLEYDAYRSDYEQLQAGPRDSTTMAKIEEAQRKYQVHREKFDKLRADVAIKLKFLEENKVKVMHKQLLLFHNAIAAYFSGNQNALEATLKQFNIKLKAPNTEKPSWIEQ